MVAMRWIIRFLGLINTAIVARILAPEDFGLVALVMIVVSLVEMFAEIGVDLVLIRNPDADRSHYDTAWTLRILTNSLLALMIFLIAPFPVRYFDDQRITLLMRVLALKPLIGGFENIGVVAFRKDLQFSKDFIFNVLSRFITVFISIGLAAALHSYWALAIAMISQQMVSTLLSYFIHPFRPRLSLGAFSEIGSISVWLLVRSLGYTLLDKVDQIVVGKMSGASALGGYFVAKSISNMLTMELLLPIGRALLPGYTKLIHTPERLFQIFLKVVGIVGSVSIAFGFGLMVVAKDFVMIVLGSKWYENVPLLEIFAFSGAFYGISTVIGPFMVALGHVRIMALFGWMQFIALAITLWFVSKSGNIIQVAWANAILAIVFTFINLQIVCRSSGNHLKLVMSTLSRPLISGVLMVIVVKILHINTIAYPPITLTLDAATAITVYITTLLILWWIAGQPDSAERELLERLRIYMGWRLPICK
jgi:lipopolysaccharide exporter